MISSRWSGICARVRQRHRELLLAVAVAGLLVAWWLYPAENEFSVLRCTISFLGSPDANRNPHGWRFYQAGMTALVLLLFSLTTERHAKLSVKIGRPALFSSTLIYISLALVMLVTWIPDSRAGEIFGIRTGALHTRLAIIAIPFMGGGIVIDCLALWWSGVRFLALWPFHVYGLVVAVGTFKLMEWERICRRHPTLPSWPGEGLHSTPLWEWIAFSYLVGFMFWMARSRFADTRAPQP